MDQEINECIDASLEAADIINQLIHNTLEFSRRNKDTFEESDLNDIIDKAIVITRGLSNKKNIKFILNFDKTLNTIKVNETSILQVFVNIISNAIEASQIDSKIYINTFNCDDHICAEVIDEGIGINDEDKDKIFDEFYTNKENGTGLGLHVCKTILNEHGASFNLTNYNDKGTIFKVIFNL